MAIAISQKEILVALLRKDQENAIVSLGSHIIDSIHNRIALAEIDQNIVVSSMIPSKCAQLEGSIGMRPLDNIVWMETY